MKLQSLHQLLTKRDVLVTKKATIQDTSFAISELQDTKPTALLTRLREGIKKSDFPVLQNIGAAEMSSLCKIFTISRPYNAIGLVENTIYISLSQAKPINLQEIFDATFRLIKSDLSSISCIPEVANFYKVLHEAGNQYVKKILDIKNTKYSRFQTPKEDLYTYAARDDEIFQKYFNYNDIRNISQIFEQNIRFEQLFPEKDKLHIHVELNLLDGILERHGIRDIQQIQMGVASSNIFEKSGCCGYCVATLNAIAEFYSISIVRSGDFPQNTPVGNWDFPYKLLNTAEKSYLFFKNLLVQYKPIIDMIISEYKDDDDSKDNDNHKGNIEVFELLKMKLQKFKEMIESMKTIDYELQELDKEIEITFSELLQITHDNSTQTHLSGDSLVYLPEDSV